MASPLGAVCVPADKKAGKGKAKRAAEAPGAK
jgi:hypothetical protein